MARLSRRTETVLFVAITLALAYSLGAAFILTGARYPLIIHTLMCVPGALALTLMWLLRHEPPRSVGFAFTDGGFMGDRRLLSACVRDCRAHPRIRREKYQWSPRIYRL